MKKYSSYNTFDDPMSRSWRSLRFLKLSLTRQRACLCLNIGSLGLFALLQYWLIRLQLLKFQDSESSEASHVLVEGRDKSFSILDISEGSFEYRFQKYFVDSQGITPLEIDSSSLKKQGISLSEYERNKKLFGPCVIDVPVPSVWSLIVSEILHPFFVFQFFSVILWSVEEYYLYSSIILILSLASVGSSVIETKYNVKNIQKMAYYTCPIEVFRGTWQTVNSSELVPGEIIKIPENTQLPCDCVLIEGSCLVEESMLTGESLPTLKTHEISYPSQNELYAGTISQYNKGECIGIVHNVGFYTLKGTLIKSILFPAPSQFEFYSDSIKYIICMFIISVIGFLWCLVSFIKEDISSFDIILNSLDLVTIIVPPALPIAMTVGTTIAVRRLRSKSIFCISPDSINASGRVSTIVFDKTGTLTEDKMQFKTVWDFSTSSESPSEKFQENLASCHSLTYVNGTLIGDPQETSIFASSNWKAVEDLSCKFLARSEKSTVKVKEVFAFVSQNKKMGVVVENKGTFIHIKGAPEVILDQCIGIDSQVRSISRNIAANGYRVLACAFKEAQSKYDSIDDKDFKFLGFILLENPLKPETKDTIEVLQDNNIKCIIATGDSVLTATSIGQQIGLISQVLIGSVQNGKVRWEDQLGNVKKYRSGEALAVTGELFEYFLTVNHQDLSDLLKNTKVFARMSPRQKTLLVQELQNYEMVGMVGDGANDCGALRAADLGLSLSNSESSIAAGFSGNSIQNVIDILLQGRSSLVTCFQSFKFILLYSLIQFACVMTLFLLNNNMLDMQYLFQDLFIIMPLTLTMAYTGAASHLSRDLPPAALISKDVLSSVLGQASLQVLGQVIIVLSFLRASWYDAEATSVDDPESSINNSVLFIFSSLQLVFICICFSIGPPFRKDAYSNIWFTGNCVLLLGFLGYATVWPDHLTMEFLGLASIPFTFRLEMMAIAVSQFIVSFIYEKIGVEFLRNKLKK